MFIIESKRKSQSPVRDPTFLQWQLLTAWSMLSELPARSHTYSSVHIYLTHGFHYACYWNRSNHPRYFTTCFLVNDTSVWTAPGPSQWIIFCRMGVFQFHPVIPHEHSGFPPSLATTMLQEMPQFAPRAFWLCYLYWMDPEVQIAESRVCALQFKAYLKVTSPPKYCNWL